MPAPSTAIVPALADPLLRMRTALRSIKRQLAPPRPSMIPDEQTAGTLTLVRPPAAMEAGEERAWEVVIENRSAVAWPCREPFAVRLAMQWSTWDGMPFGEPVRMVLPTVAFPGEPMKVSMPMVAPGFVGDYRLDVWLEQNATAFEGVPSHRPRATVMVPVVGPRATDIDYHEVFRNANLAENHWWVVGAYHSKEQYERSQRERLEMLVKHGFTPDSHLLDVGCGTGQMAAACEGYLSAQGGYAGTDIGKEAIEFCRRQYRRPNFRFAQGGMTTIPFDARDGRFDMAIYFSVFTHTFPDETALLLAETKRLLRPAGTIIADVITSPLVERGAGHRGEMVLNPNHMFAIARAIGFEGTVIGRWPWNPRAERLMIQFRRADA